MKWKSMKAMFTLTIIFIIILSCLSGCVQQSHSDDNSINSNYVNFQDSLGNNITLPKTAERIIAINSNAAEMLIAIGAKDKIVGLSSTGMNDRLLSTNLPDARSIGSWMNPSVEDIITLEPDVLICYSSHKPRNIDQLIAANITMIFMDCYRLDSLAKDARALGVLTGNEAKAEEYARFQEKYIGTITEKTETLTDKPDVYFETMATFTAVSPGSGGDILINMSGGRNIADNGTASTQKVSAEWVIKQNPDVILKVWNGNETMDELKIAYDELTVRTGMPEIEAVNKDRVYIIHDDIAFGPRGAVGLSYVAKILHPELFPELDPDSINKEYAGKFIGGVTTGAYIYPEP